MPRSVDAGQHGNPLAFEERPGTRRNVGAYALTEVARHRRDTGAPLHFPLPRVKDAHGPLWTGELSRGFRRPKGRGPRHGL